MQKECHIWSDPGCGLKGEQPTFLRAFFEKAPRSCPRLSADLWRAIAGHAVSWADVHAIGRLSRDTGSLRRDAKLAAEFLAKRLGVDLSLPSDRADVELAAIRSNMACEHAVALIEWCGSLGTRVAGHGEPAVPLPRPFQDQPLLAAAGRGRAAVVTHYMLLGGVDDGDAHCALLEAVAKGHREVVEVLVCRQRVNEALTVSPDQADKWRWAMRGLAMASDDGYSFLDGSSKIAGLTALMVAAYHGRLAIASFLVARGASVLARATQHNGYVEPFAALDIAAHNGDAAFCALLTGAGASDPRAHLWAIESASPETVELLMEAARANGTLSESLRLPPSTHWLHGGDLARKERVAQILRTMAAFGCRIADIAAAIAEHVAAQDVVELCLEQGADPNAVLLGALLGDNTETIRTALSRGADANHIFLCRSLGHAAVPAVPTPVVLRARSEGAIGLLVDAGARLADVANGDTILHLLAKHHYVYDAAHSSAVRCLCRRMRLGIDAVDAHGHTALAIAAVRRQHSMVKAMLDAGADPIAAGQSGKTPAHEVCDAYLSAVVHLRDIHWIGVERVLATLVSYGADLDAQDAGGAM